MLRLTFVWIRLGEVFIVVVGRVKVSLTFSCLFSVDDADDDDE